MALSRAAAAAARKAAKNRGLQGNRAKDGSMLTADDVPTTLHTNRTPEQVKSLSDTQLKEAFADAADEIDELTALGEQMQERNWIGYDIEKYNIEMAAAEERLKVIGDEIELRNTFREEPTVEQLSRGYFNPETDF